MRPCAAAARLEIEIVQEDRLCQARFRMTLRLPAQMVRFLRRWQRFQVAESVSKGLTARFHAVGV